MTYLQEAEKMEHEISKIKEFITAGKAIFTLKNEETGNRFTFKDSKPKDENKNLFCVSVGQKA